jgi:hypothetical protein
VTEKLRSKLDNADMQGAPQALLRAAQRAREIARRTGTQLVVVHNGVLRELDPDSPELDAAAGESVAKGG